ncbi:hypothetical protein EJB05_50524, partial [Eragrostis curvula]
MIALVSSDNERFEVSEAAASQSQTISNMIEDGCADGGIPLPNVTSSVLAKVLEYCRYWCLLREFRARRRQLLCPGGRVVLGLLDVAAQKVADLMKGKTPEQIRRRAGMGITCRGVRPAFHARQMERSEAGNRRGDGGTLDGPERRWSAGTNASAIDAGLGSGSRLFDEEWTLNVCCDGVLDGRTFVPKKMDRDLICYFNLVDIISSFGYSSSDCMYYSKKHDNGLKSMVLIQADEQVIEMLREYEPTKIVNLYVMKNGFKDNPIITVDAMVNAKSIVEVDDVGLIEPISGENISSSSSESEDEVAYLDMGEHCEGDTDVEDLFPTKDSVVSNRSMPEESSQQRDFTGHVHVHVPPSAPAGRASKMTSRRGGGRGRGRGRGRWVTSIMQWLDAGGSSSGGATHE